MSIRWVPTFTSQRDGIKCLLSGPEVRGHECVTSLASLTDGPDFMKILHTTFATRREAKAYPQAAGAVKVQGTRRRDGSFRVEKVLS
jgi:hypothetical protein